MLYLVKIYKNNHWRLVGITESPDKRDDLVEELIKRGYEDKIKIEDILADLMLLDINFDIEEA